MTYFCEFKYYFMCKYAYWSFFKKYLTGQKVNWLIIYFWAPNFVFFMHITYLQNRLVTKEN